MSHDVLETVVARRRAVATPPDDPPSPPRRRHRRAAGVLALALRVLEAIFADDLSDAIDRLPDHRKARDLAAQYGVMRGFNR